MWLCENISLYLLLENNICDRRRTSAFWFCQHQSEWTFQLVEFRGSSSPQHKWFRPKRIGKKPEEGTVVVVYTYFLPWFVYHARARFALGNTPVAVLGSVSESQSGEKNPQNHWTLKVDNFRPRFSASYIERLSCRCSELVRICKAQDGTSNSIGPVVQVFTDVLSSCSLFSLPWLVWAVAGEGGAKRSCLTSCHCYKATVQGFAGLVMISDSTNELAIGTHFTCTHFHWYPRGQALCIHAKCVNRDKFNSSQSHQCCLLHPYHAYFYLHEPDDMLCLYTFYTVLMSKNPVPFVFFNCKPQGFTTWRRGAGGRSPPKDDQRILQTRLSNPSLEQCKAPT